MTLMKSLTVLASLLLFSAGAAAAGPEMPSKHFECHVLTASGKHGLVRIQADSLQAAGKGVIGASAVTQGQSRDRATSVVECVERHGSRKFADGEFQKFVDSLNG